MTVREMLNSASDDAIASAILRGAFKKCAYCIYDDASDSRSGRASVSESVHRTVLQRGNKEISSKRGNRNKGR